MNYIAEGQSNAAKFGFVDGTNSTTVTPAVNQNCPAPFTGMTSCMKVTITKSIPLTFSKILGYSGTGGGGTQTIIATAIAKSADSPVSDCILSLAPTESMAYHVNGGPKFDLTGCAIQVNGDADLQWRRLKRQRLFLLRLPETTSTAIAVRQPTPHSRSPIPIRANIPPAIFLQIPAPIQAHPPAITKRTRLWE